VAHHPITFNQHAFSEVDDNLNRYPIASKRVPIKVLVADDNAPMRTVIRKVLNEDARIAVIAEAADFVQTVQRLGECKPDVLLLDLNLPQPEVFTPAIVRAQLRCVPVLAISLDNDNEAHALAESYGALCLLDKMTLYSQLIPAILEAVKGRQRRVM
jgi:chemotaxis response regulator CheB